MKARICVAPCIALLISTLAPAGAHNEATRILPGTTVIQSQSPLGIGVVTMVTKVLRGDDAGSCPASRAWTALGPNSAAVIEEMKITINGNSIPVPLSVYASLFEPGGASLKFDDGTFVLRIDGADGGEAYFVLLYFDAKGVNRMLVYDSEFPDHPTEETRYHRVVSPD